MASALTKHDLARLINTLIGRYFGGNVLKAAKEWGLPQPTVHRLTTGATRRPRRRTLAPIAKYHRTTVEALLTGEGPDPLALQPLPMGEYREFSDVVNKLALDPDTRFAVMSLPTGIGAAHTVLCEWHQSYEAEFPEVPAKVASVARKATWLAEAASYHAWTQFLDGLITAYGIERVREKLQSELNRTRMGFHPIGMRLVDEESGRQLLDELALGLPRNREAAGVLQRDAPALPPLNAIPAEQLRPRRGRPRKSRPYRNYDEDTNASD